jgi:hypothetical protein
MTVSKIKRVPIREAFRHEAHHFTVWLETNIEALSDELGFKLTVVEREKSVGSFNVDLLCEDEFGNSVIIENQLERTDHTHLGQLLTYLVNLEAKTAIWVATEIRPEHQRVIDWFNTSTSTDLSFYAVQVEAVRIDDSPYAPLFTIMAQPDEQSREIGEQKKDWAERHSKHKEFWAQFLSKLNTQSNLFSKISPRAAHYISTSSGFAGITYGCSLRVNDSSVWMDIFFKAQPEMYPLIFETLRNQNDVIEEETGLELKWTISKEGNHGYVSHKLNYGMMQPEYWESLQHEMINAIVSLQKSVQPRLLEFR